MDKQRLKSLVKHEIKYLLQHIDHPNVSSDIDLIWIFSGPGTFYEALKPEDDTYFAWMDRYRILYGVTLAKHIVSKRLNKDPKDIAKDEFLSDGPKILYNGTPDENKNLRTAIETGTIGYPKEKIIILDYFVTRLGTIKPFFSTKDQIASIVKPVLEKLLPIRKVALVSHASHFPRILRYLKKYKTFPDGVGVEVFALKLPKKAQNEIIEEEMQKTWEYFVKGDLSWDPISF